MRFVIFFLARTGSTMLWSMMNNGKLPSDYPFLFELFINSPAKKKLFEELNLTEEPVDCLNLDIGNHINSLFSMYPTARACKIPLGIEFIYGKPIPTDFYSRIEDNFKPIVIYRKNLQQAYVSREIAKQTNQWYVDCEEKIKSAQIDIDVDKLEQFKAFHKEKTEFTISKLKSPIIVSYEELCTKQGIEDLENKLNIKLSLSATVKQKI